MNDLKASVDAIPYWYHRIELPGGVTTPGWAPHKIEKYEVPERLDGERVLDVGAWDGFWTFEALKRGASWVTAIDDFSDELGKLHVSRESQWKTFDLCQKALDARFCQRLTMSVYDVAKLKCEPFDRIFAFGLLYHLRYPLLALDELRKVCKGTIHIETAICNGIVSPYTGEPITDAACHAEFYPNDEFGANHSNWWVPTLKCVEAMLLAAGFKNIKTWTLTPMPLNLSQLRGFASAEV